MNYDEYESEFYDHSLDPFNVYDEFESEFYDHSLDPFNVYEEYLDSHITKEDLMYLGDIELARQLKEEV